MTEYYNINFNNRLNEETDQLDKLAREINNKKTSLCKQVANDYNKDETLWKNSIDDVINSQKFSFLNFNKNNNSNNSNSNLVNTNKVNNFTDDFSVYTTNTYNNTDNNTDKSFNFSMSSDLQSYDSNFTDKSIDSFGSGGSSFIDSETIDSYLKSAKNKKNVKFNKIVQSIDYDECSKNGENIFDHIKTCINCKNKLLKYINGTNSNPIDLANNQVNLANNQVNLANNQVNLDNNNSILNTINSKEIIIMVMIGVFIMIMLDLILRKKNNNL